MLRIIRIFFISMGVAFTILLCGLAYVVIVDPFHIRPIIALFMHTSPATIASPVQHTDMEVSTSTVATTSPSRPAGSGTKTTASGPTAAQREALKSVGINPTSFANGVTPEQMVCFVNTLGAARVAEIKSGAVPTATEFMSVRGCL